MRGTAPVNGAVVTRSPVPKPGRYTLKEVVMMQTWAVRLDPQDGAQDTVLVQANDSTAAKEAVLKWFHSIWMDKVTIEDLTVQSLGNPDSIFILKSDLPVEVLTSTSGVEIIMGGK